LTVALTPGIALSVLSIVATHEEQVMPPRLKVIGSRAVLIDPISIGVLMSCAMEKFHHLIK
jgi:hypothetical protein